MKVEFKESFLRDLKRIDDKAAKARLRETISAIEAAPNLHQIGNLKKLRSAPGCHRIRIGDYRVGLLVDGDTVTFVRFLNRKDLYRYFP